jgi:hypothetical protein
MALSALFFLFLSLSLSLSLHAHRVAKTGEIVENMNPYSWNSTNGQLAFLFNFLFYVAFAVILLNLVFAVIVDSFGGIESNQQYQLNNERTTTNSFLQS